VKRAHIQSHMLDETRAYPSMAEKRPNVPNHRHDISLREVSALADLFKELSADGELESEGVFCPRLEPLVEFVLEAEGERMRQTPKRR